MSRADNLGALPFADYADNDPNRLPMDNPEARPCEACNAEPWHACEPWCIGVARAMDDPDVILCGAGCERPVTGHGDYCRRCFRDLNGPPS